MTKPNTDYPMVRAHCICARCYGVKNEHLLLCWPCHHAEKAQNDGSYSDEVEAQLQQLENTLRESQQLLEEGRRADKFVALYSTGLPKLPPR